MAKLTAYLPEHLYLLLILLLMPFLTSCQTHDRIELDHLLLQVDDLPGEWSMAVDSPSSNRGQAPLGGGPPARQYLAAFFHHPAGDGSAGAHHMLYVFGNEAIARVEFEHLVTKAYAAPNRHWVAQAPPFQPAPMSSASDIRCSEDGAGPVCRHLARYGRIVSDLSIHLYGYNSQLIPIPVLEKADVFDVIGTLDLRLAAAGQ